MNRRGIFAEAFLKALKVFFGVFRGYFLGIVVAGGRRGCRGKRIAGGAMAGECSPSRRGYLFEVFRAIFLDFMAAESRVWDRRSQGR